MQGMRDGEVTRLLGACRDGEPQAEARLSDPTYGELRKIAAAHLRREFHSGCKFDKILVSGPVLSPGQKAGPRGRVSTARHSSPAWESWESSVWADDTRFSRSLIS
jgi:hypothetical protein